ncbi:hypothetical protein BT96DRAFT_998574 [Gymnopus androsaceus JB14]|uniref:Uncharacterized protein n=1 Tax=Gymnopus androsaceus JB14 TaxID=1447944 RepID=A0A6A4H8G9_9AGAR|nr:hypothetical protein BT96DRAFT_998574 [Gymnopus androsaceus JB14]
MPYHYGASSSDVEWWPDSAEDGNQGDEDKTEEPKLQSSSPSSNDGWDYNVSAKGMYTKQALEASLTLLRDIAATSTKDWHEAVESFGPPEDEALRQTVTREEMERLLHRGKFLDEICRQVINALHERDMAVQKATSLEREVRLLRQDMIRLGENLYSSPCGSNFVRDVRRVATGLIQVGRDGSEG